MDPSSGPHGMKRRSLKQDKLARVYDSEILPIWAERFGRMLLAEARIPDKGLVLNVACGTGYPALDLLERMETGRIIAIDSSSALLDVAREKAGDLSGKRIFFRTEGGKETLSFDNDVYDLTFSNLGLGELALSPAESIAELARVTAPGGQLLVSLPLQGTWAEFLDIYREVLTKHDRHDTLERLAEYEATLPDPDVALEWMENAGLEDVDLVVDEFSLLFKSSREFFFAPVIEFGPLREWKRLAGKGQEMQDIFWFIKEAIDAYFGGRAFSVTVVAGCLSGRKPQESEEPEDALLEPPPPDPDDVEQEEHPAAEVSGLLSADIPEDVSGLKDPFELEDDEPLQAFAEDADESTPTPKPERRDGEGAREEPSDPDPFGDDDATAADDGANQLPRARAPLPPPSKLPPPPVSAADFEPPSDGDADSMDIMVTHPRLDQSSVPLLDTGEISIHELDEDDLEVVEDEDIEEEKPADVDEEADTNIRTIDDLPDHLQKAIRDHKDDEV